MAFREGSIKQIIIHDDNKIEYKIKNLKTIHIWSYFSPKLDLKTFPINRHVLFSTDANDIMVLGMNPVQLKVHDDI